MKGRGAYKRMYIQREPSKRKCTGRFGVTPEVLVARQCCLMAAVTHPRTPRQQETARYAVGRRQCSKQRSGDYFLSGVTEDQDGEARAPDRLACTMFWQAPAAGASGMLRMRRRSKADRQHACH